jgi:hypothetical protein
MLKKLTNLIIFRNLKVYRLNKNILFTKLHYNNMVSKFNFCTNKPNFSEIDNSNLTLRRLIENEILNMEKSQNTENVKKFLNLIFDLRQEVFLDLEVKNKYIETSTKLLKDTNLINESNVNELFPLIVKNAHVLGIKDNFWDNIEEYYMKNLENLGI